MPESRKALFLRNLPTELVREAKAAAARRGKSLTAFVSEALTRSLRVEDTPSDEPDVLAADIAWYQRNRSKLLRRYRGEYVAIVDGAVVDHDRDFSTLAARVFGRFGNRSIYMPRVQRDEAVVRIRSPRLRTP
jgi:plasmid stability protein